MTMRTRVPTSPGVRHRRDVDTRGIITKGKPEKYLLRGVVKKTGGRNAQGRISVRHQGGGEKQMLREIDFKRSKHGIPAKVMAIEYDPIRRANIALDRKSTRLTSSHTSTS